MAILRGDKGRKKKSKRKEREKKLTNFIKKRLNLKIFGPSQIAKVGENSVSRTIPQNVFFYINFTSKRKREKEKSTRPFEPIFEQKYTIKMNISEFLPARLSLSSPWT